MIDGDEKQSLAFGAWPSWLLGDDPCCCKQRVASEVKDGSGSAFEFVKREKILAEESAAASHARNNPNEAACNRQATAVSDAILDVKQGAMSDGELLERGEMEIDIGTLYAGQWKGTKVHGKGTLTRRDGSCYVGEFVDGRAHGFGKFVAMTGVTYQGGWVEDSAHGHGRYVHEDGTVYEGSWENNQKHGWGKELWPDGTRFDGVFANGNKHGHGTFRSDAGVIVYSGQLKADKMDGDGTYYFSNGRKYSGQWCDGQMHGRAEMEWPDGSRFSGQYQQDFRQGEGRFSYPDGRQYRGQWVSGKQDGHGVLIAADGVETPGIWKAGIMVPEDGQDKDGQDNEVISTMPETGSG